MVKQIELTKGKVTLVDDDIYEQICDKKWNAIEPVEGYFYAGRCEHIDTINGKQNNQILFLHRWITNPPKGYCVDHINGNGLDNRRENLRVCSPRQNQQNRKKIHSSKYPGVSWNKRSARWDARIMVKGKRYYLGTYIDEREAAMAYEQACRDLVGEELVCKMDA